MNHQRLLKSVLFERSVSRSRSVIQRHSFTLVELMISISIIAILASATMFALYGVIDDAKEARTKAVIARLHEMVVQRWDGYQARAVPLQLPPGTPPLIVARSRLAAIREMMRLELPDRKSDVTDAPVVLTVVRENPVPPPATLTTAHPGLSVWRAYQRQAIASLRAHVAPSPLPANPFDVWTPRHQGAECLYLFVSTLGGQDGNGLDFFRDSEIGDVDGDGMKEILDGWGSPIEFLRWAPGFLNYSDIQVRDSDVAADPFDPLKVDPRWTPADGDPTNDPFALFPLIFSSGRDKSYDIAQDYDTNPSTVASDIDDPNFDNFRYRDGNSLLSGSGPYNNDPYHTESTSLGNGFGLEGPGAGDNLSNHLLGAN